MRELIVDNFAGGGRVRRILAQFFLDGMVWMDGKLSVTWKPVGRELLSRTLAASASDAAGAGLLGCTGQGSNPIPLLYLLRVPTPSRRVSEAIRMELALAA